MAGGEHDAVRVGCAGLPPRMSRHAYFDKLPFLEVEPPPVLTAHRASRWQREVPDYGAIAAAVTVGPTELSAEAVAAGPTGALAAATRAEVIVVHTRPEVTPSAATRADLERFFGELASTEMAQGAALAWVPTGLWEPMAAAKQAAAMKVLWAFDPIARDPLGEMDSAMDAAMAGGEAYMRPSRLGSRRPLSPEDLDELVELCEQLDRGWVAFTGGANTRHASRLRRALGQPFLGARRSER